MNIDFDALDKFLHTDRYGMYVPTQRKKMGKFTCPFCQCRMTVVRFQVYRCDGVTMRLSCCGCEQQMDVMIPVAVCPNEPVGGREIRKGLSMNTLWFRKYIRTGALASTAFGNNAFSGAVFSELKGRFGLPAKEVSDAG